MAGSTEMAIFGVAVLCIIAPLGSATVLELENCQKTFQKTLQTDCVNIITFATCVADASEGVSSGDATYRTISDASSAALLENKCDLPHWQPRISTSQNRMRMEVGADSDVVFSRYARETVSLTDVVDRLNTLEDTKAGKEELPALLKPQTDAMSSIVGASLSAAVKDVAELQDRVGDEYDNLTNSIDQKLADMSAKISQDTDIKINTLKTDVVDKLAKDFTDRQDEQLKCETAGQILGTEGCEAAPVQFDDSDIKCTSTTLGLTKYTKGQLQVCTANGFESIPVQAAGVPTLGSTKENPAPSCDMLKNLGLIPAAGKRFYLGKKNPSLWKCMPDGGAISYGDGSDGDITITRHNTNYGPRSQGYGYDENKYYQVFMSDIFPDYDPENYDIPQYQNVVIKAGVELRGMRYTNSDGAASHRSGSGSVAFRASGTVTIENGAWINVDHLGHQGATSNIVRYNGNMRNSVNNPGWGPGAGDGGGGGYNCCHGTGGGGGSFKIRGEYGISDLCRQTRMPWNWARPGEVVAYKSKYFHPTEHMGSGGGAGGAGHPGSSNCPPGNGGSGGGLIQIMAASLKNSGKLQARGEQGRPDHGICQWPSGNPQVGGGGGGSGGMVKVITKDGSSLGRAEVNGGARSIRQAWGNCAWSGNIAIPGGKGRRYPTSMGNDRMQRGGAGGEGYAIITTNTNDN